MMICFTTTNYDKQNQLCSRLKFRLRSFETAEPTNQDLTKVHEIFLGQQRRA